MSNNTQNIPALTTVIKRDGRVVPLDPDKITNAIFRAAQSVGGTDQVLAQNITQKIIEHLEQTYSEKNPTVEDIQDTVEKVLIKEGHAKTAKAYILYRERHKQFRDMRTAVLDGKSTSLKLSLNSLLILKERYLKKDSARNFQETPEDLFCRVAHTVAHADTLYGLSAERTEETFYNLLSRLEFLPNSPTLAHAGGSIQQLASCFVLPVEDSLEGIFDALKNAALIHKQGGGTGFSFSRLRPRNDLISTLNTGSSGPIAFMKVFDAALETVKQGGKRKGANMAILRVDHPDILQFITMKSDHKTLQNFNISVALTEAFMQALEKNENYELINPRTGKPSQTLPARHVWDLIILEAWKTGDPGIVFIDRINASKANPTPFLGNIESTNPCGEQPLFPFEACNLGSINLAKVVKEGQVQWEHLKQVIHQSIHFLDNVIDTTHYPLPRIEQLCKANRRIGLGVMGFADFLYQLNVRYDSEEGVAWARKIMQFISCEADTASQTLAAQRGQFINFDQSIYAGKTPLRNCTRTTIAPTGTISMIADCSSGIEPLYALVFNKIVLDGKELLYVNEEFERVAHAQGFYSEELMKRIANQGSIQNFSDIPQNVKDIFRISHDMNPYWHIRIQAAFQEFTDNAVSKTVNFPNSATPKDIEQAYFLAYQLGCKGITAYRDGSKDIQVFNLPTKEKNINEKILPVTVIKIKEDACPDCKTPLYLQEGCALCPQCGYSLCLH